MSGRPRVLPRSSVDDDADKGWCEALVRESASRCSALVLNHTAGVEACFSERGHHPRDSRHYQRWLSDRLRHTRAERLPRWVRLVDSVDTAMDVTTHAPPSRVQLFEAFRGINGRVEAGTRREERR